VRLGVRFLRVGPGTPGTKFNGGGNGGAGLLGGRSLWHKINSLVFMGMGEPLANFLKLVHALQILRSPMGLNFGARHVTVSTTGLVPQIQMLAASAPKINLAISLHAADDETRKKLLPKSSVYPSKSF
jgi:adenine C2-methylase RlmN of 23S rRNA A2503 and tRNA A37